MRVGVLLLLLLLPPTRRALNQRLPGGDAERVCAVSDVCCSSGQRQRVCAQLCVSAVVSGGGCCTVAAV
jgi:hypothetical protein